MNQDYADIVRLLVRVAPLVFVEPGFALKGGTAINLFVQDLPRLSVDLDLVFTNHELDRSDALAAISTAVANMAAHMTARGFQVHVPSPRAGEEVKLLIRQGRFQVKVEINPVMRGTIYPVLPMRMVAAARDQFMADLRLPVLATEELYAGKLVAAMDRSHPRDWFDVMLLLAQQGITPQIRRCFVAYLAAHNRPSPNQVRYQLHIQMFQLGGPLAMPPDCQPQRSLDVRACQADGCCQAGASLTQANANGFGVRMDCNDERALFPVENPGR